MVYVVALVSLFLVFSAATALRPSRRGLFAVLAYPVGWAAGELPAQGIVAELVALGVLWWWGWPAAGWQRAVVVALGAIVLLENLALIAIQFLARRTVRRAMRHAPLAPLEIPRARDDAFATWWYTALQFPFHPRDMQLHRNVAYGPAPRHRLDVWRLSTTPRGAPVIFYVHGGSWVFGDKREQGRPMLHEFVRRGWVVVTINYRLAPADPWPAQIEDVTRAFAWVKKYVATYGGDPDRVVVAGASAGGHLASLLALSSEDPTWRPADVNGVSDWSVRGAIPFYGVLEMTGDETHWRGLGKGLRLLLEHRVVQRPFDGHEDLYRAMSPLERIAVGSPPFLVFQGVTDTLVDVGVARGFVARFREIAAAPIYYVELPFTQHAYDVSASVRTSATTRAAVAFAESVVAPRPPVTAALLASYQVPPNELTIEVDGTWHAARDVAAREGHFYVVTSDNPWSQRLSEERNDRRRQDLATSLEAHGVTRWPSASRDPRGDWPTEYGFALVGVDVETACAYARAWGQLALYEVTPDAVRVLDAATRRLLTPSRA